MAKRATLRRRAWLSTTAIGVALAAAATTAARADSDFSVTILQDVGGQGSNYSSALNESGQSVGYSYTGAGFVAVLWSASGAGAVLQDVGGQTYSAGVAINASGQSVGYSSIGFVPTRFGSTLGFDAVLWSPSGAGTVLQDVGGQGLASASAINASGQSVGYSLTASGYDAVKWSASGAGTVLQDVGGRGSSFAMAVNGAGQSIGYSYTSGGTDAVLWSASGAGTVLQDVGGRGSSSATAVNAAGQSIGYSYSSGGTDAVLWSASGAGTVLQDVGGQGRSYVSALNASGQSVGQSKTSSGYEAALWSASGAGTVLQDVGGQGNSDAVALNAAGLSVGSSTTSTGTDAVLWSVSGVGKDLAGALGPGWSNTQALAIKDHGDVLGYGDYAGGVQSFLLAPNAVWSAAGGQWDNVANWNFGGMGALTVTPGATNAVTLAPAVAATISGPSENTTVPSLTIGDTTHASTVTLALGAGTLTATGGTTINPNGKLTGSGTLAGAVTNAGLVQVTNGQTMTLDGDVANSGRVNVWGNGGSAELDVTGGLTNAASGVLNLQNANFSTGAGLVNDGAIQVTSGYSNVSGAVTNEADGHVTVSGNAFVTFYDPVTNEGAFKVSQGSTATFFGQVSGVGGFAGTGDVFFEGGRHIGDSPAVVSDTVDETFDTTSILSLDLGGLAPGTCHGAGCHAYGQLIFDGSVVFDGGTLDVDLYNGFAPSAGEVFDIFVYDGAHSGTFGAIDLPTLAKGLSWDTADLYTTGAISVEGGVPEPATWALAVIGFAGLGLAGAGRVRTRREGRDAERAGSAR